MHPLHPEIYASPLSSCIPVICGCKLRSTANSQLCIPVIIDRQLTLNFELWVEIFRCRQGPTCFHNKDSETVSDCLSVPRENNHLILVNISPTVVIDTSTKKSSRVLQHGNPKFLFYLQKIEIEFWFVFWHVPKCWNHPSFVNISTKWYIIGKVFTSSTALIPKNLIFFST